MPTMTERQQQKAIQALLDFLNYRFSKELGRSSTARVVYGCIDRDEGEAEQYAVRVFTILGDQFTGTVRLISDAQSGGIDEPPSAGMSDAALRDRKEGVSISDLWALVHDEVVSAPHRLEAISKLLGADRENTIKYVASELAREGIHEDWVIALVFLAEDVHFPADCQQIVKDALLRIAHSFRKSTRAGADKVVWSAIRRASSLLAPAQVGLLVPFLEREGVVDARAVTLKCVEKLFLPAPPADPESVRQIGERAHMLAKKFLDPDIFGGGDNALLAQSAVCALAAIGDARFGSALTLAASLNRRWLNHQLRTRLDILRNSWQSKDAAIAASGAFRNLETELTRLG
jgi:hypothetical protein